MDDQRLEMEIQKLGNRSSKILGGYVTENLFADLFVKGKFPYSQAWWFSKTRDRRRYCFVEKAQLSRLDRKIAAMLKQVGQDCSQLFLVGGEWHVKPVGEMETGEWTLEEFIAREGLTRIPKRAGAIDRSQDEMRQLARCVEHYQDLHILTDIQRSISIEDLFLNQYFYTSNIDLFIGRETADGMEPVCLEIKFKDEFYPIADPEGEDGRPVFKEEPVFGMDCYQLDLEYSLLERAGMKIYNVVLRNDSRNRARKTTTNIFDYLDRNKDKPLDWRYVRVSRLAGYEKYQMESVKTNFKGVANKARTVYCVPLKLYKPLNDIEQLLDDDTLLDAKGEPLDYQRENGRRCPICDGMLVERQGPYSRFLGCSRFPDCRYTRKIRE